MGERMMKVLLEENRGVYSNNLENTVRVDLENKVRLLPNEGLTDDFSLYGQYNRERDECQRFRLIAVVNPVCSNVLFNAKTEMVINEGSPSCSAITDSFSLTKESVARNAINTTASIGYYEALRNTEYSHEKNGGFVYHCGYDIFNNHMLRKKGFVHVNRISSDALSECGPVYNTIMDYQRDDRGRIVEQEISVGVDKNGEKTKMHLYQYDTILSMRDAFRQRCEEKDGWWGFVNPGNIEIPTNSGNTVMVNRMMASNKACEYIDLYPDRSLFSFVPKYNGYRRRIERNWDYCITYPYKSDYEVIDRICGGRHGAVRASVRYAQNSSSVPVMECTCYFRHNLKAGDYVTFYYYNAAYDYGDSGLQGKEYVAPRNMVLCGTSVYKADSFAEKKPVKIKDVLSVGPASGSTDDGTSYIRMQTRVRVMSVGDAAGDHQDRVFTVRFSDVESVYEYMNLFGCFFKKNVNNTECMYYARKFRKIRNAEGGELRSEVNKAGFGRNIYGDDVAQIVFTDDVDVTGLVDNNGRPVSEVFLTVVKRNAGHDRWYNTDGLSRKDRFASGDVEYSHCFGKVTSGIDFGGLDNEPFDYNARYLHNMDSAVTRSDKAAGNTFSAWGDTVLNGRPDVLEDNITADMDEFYGDIVEYDVSNAQETVVGQVCHRFNTAQRESFGMEFRDIYQDVIASDDYDEVNGYGTKWTVESYYLNAKENSKLKKGTARADALIYGNIYPEGYIYVPHMEYRIREEDDDISSSSAKYINYSKPVLTQKDGEYYQLEIDAPVGYSFYKGDYIGFWNESTSELSWGEITAVSGLHVTLRFAYDSFGTITSSGEELSSEHFRQGSGKRVLYAFWSTDNVPLYARYSSGERRFVWRKIVPPSEMMQDDERYDTPFSNGRFYIEKNFSFFLRRQDPSGKYGLSIPLFRVHEQVVANVMQGYIISGYEPIDLSDLLYQVNNALTFCY